MEKSSLHEETHPPTAEEERMYNAAKSNGKARGLTLEAFAAKRRSILGKGSAPVVVLPNGMVTAKTNDTPELRQSFIQDNRDFQT